jgi:hypothetical protein
MRFLNNPETDTTKKYSEYYTIDERHKRPIKIRKEYLVLSNSPYVLNLLGKDCNSLKDILDKVSSLSENATQENNKITPTGPDSGSVEIAKNSKPPADHCNIPDEVNEVIDEPEQQTSDIPLTHEEQLIQNELMDEATNALLYDSESNKTEEPAQIPASDNPKIDFDKMQRQFFFNKRSPD